MTNIVNSLFATQTFNETRTINKYDKIHNLPMAFQFVANFHLISLNQLENTHKKTDNCNHIGNCK